MAHMQPQKQIQDVLSADLEALSATELAACARVLALSIARHRATFGIVPLSGNPHALRDGLPDAEHELSVQAHAAVREAVQLVRESVQLNSAAAGSAEAVESQPLSGADKRGQLRISMRAPVDVTHPDGEWMHRALLRDISWGGASVVTPTALPTCERMRLLLPAARGTKIPILATVLERYEQRDEFVYRLRFDSLSPDDEARLQQVLEILLTTTPDEGRRSEARLVHRLEIECGDTGDFRATIEDISTDGLMLTVLEPLALNQSLLLHLSCAETALQLALRARVVHQTPISNGEIQAYQVGLHFEHPTEQLRQRVSAVLRELALLRPAEFARVQLD
jgi:c-di-GMP-binding flagellar brake protein YcgR